MSKNLIVNKSFAYELVCCRAGFGNGSCRAPVRHYNALSLCRSPSRHYPSQIENRLVTNLLNYCGEPGILWWTGLNVTDDYRWMKNGRPQVVQHGAEYSCHFLIFLQRIGKGNSHE